MFEIAERAMAIHAMMGTPRFLAAAAASATLAAAPVGAGDPASRYDDPARRAAPAAAQPRMDPWINPLRDIGIGANNVFFYYADVERAARFYTETLGFQVVADYGYAKILRLAETSFLTLVDAARGMHTADEPKTTALALVTGAIDAWHAHVTARGVPLRAPYRPGAGRPHDSFTAIDPEGYYLEFERFNDHPENASLTPALAKLPALPAAPRGSPPGGSGPALTLDATVLWLYYKDLAAAQRFYEQKLGFTLVVDQGWAKIYQTSRSGFVGLVDQARGMHRATEKKGVTVSFITDAVDRWFAYVKDAQAFPLRSQSVNQDSAGRYRAFVGYDPEGYYLEFDAFLPHPANTALLDALRLR
jgi:catechol 2,3-dioxygenase-like lactoylglutathione lyase family enzyme